MSGPTGFTVKSELYTLFVGAGELQPRDYDPLAATSAAHSRRREEEEKRLRRRFERSAHDVKGLLEELQEHGVPLRAWSDGLPLVVHPGVPAEPSRLRLHGRGPEQESWTLELAVERPLSDAVLRRIDGAVQELLWPPPPPMQRVHHLNCLTLCPIGARLANERGYLVCHCLLIESEQGLILVDTGLGGAALTSPARHTSPMFVRALRPRLDPTSTAARQIDALGFRAADVRHVVLTHLDVDHAGGLMDFPQAEVHVLDDEMNAALRPASLLERQRYNGAMWAHDVKWRLHATRGERWYGFECVRDIPSLPPEILLVPLRGHSRGHCGVAVDVGGRWLLHCGDAYFHKDEMDLEHPRCPPALAAFQSLVAADDKMRRGNQARLRELARGLGEGISLFCAHDPDDLARMGAERALRA